MKTYRNIYFIGIGGIGMSAIARYYLHLLPMHLRQRASASITLMTYHIYLRM